MREFHHIGIPVGEKQPGMVYYESISCWATDPDSTQGRIEYIFFEADTPITEPVLSTPHVAFRVDNLAEQNANLTHWTQMVSGGHFAPAEEPELLVEDILQPPTLNKHLRHFFLPSVTGQTAASYAVRSR